MQAAQELIREKRYDEARKLLEGVDHPKAREWLGKLDALTPGPPASGRRGKWRRSGCLLALICGVLGIGMAAVGQQGGGGRSLAPAQPARTESAARATAPVTPSATITETATMTKTPIATTRPRGYVHRDDYGDAWPFTVDDGIVDCEPGDRIVFRVGRITYAVNGLAQSWAEQEGYADIRPIWRDDPKGQLPKVSIHSIILLGMELCRGTQSKVEPGRAAMCNGIDDLDCSDFSSSREANAHLAQCGDEDRLDRDGDGQACEST